MQKNLEKGAVPGHSAKKKIYVRTEGHRSKLANNQLRGPYIVDIVNRLEVYYTDERGKNRRTHVDLCRMFSRPVEEEKKEDEAREKEKSESEQETTSESASKSEAE